MEPKAARAKRPTSRRELKKSKRGFTLIEMGVVITLVALGAALITPNLARWQSGAARRAFPSELRRLFSNARETAILARAPRSVSYSEEASGFTVSWEDSETSESRSGATVRLPSGIELGRMTSGGNEATPADWRVEIQPDGTTEAAGFELLESEATMALTISKDGHVRLLAGSLPEPETERWQAGDLEIRE